MDKMILEPDTAYTIGKFSIRLTDKGILEILHNHNAEIAIRPQSSNRIVIFGTKETKQGTKIVL